MSSKKQVIITEKGPKPIGPYSPGIRTEDLLFVSGTLGVDPTTGKFPPGGIAAQTRQVLVNLTSILEAGGSSIADVVKTTVFMADLTEFSKMNAIYAEFFTQAAPARSTVQVAALPAGAAIEIEAIAIVK